MVVWEEGIMKKYSNGDYFEITNEETELDKACPMFVKNQIEMLKRQLCSTDYKAIKYAEGWINDDEFAPIKAERQKIRVKINNFEKQLISESELK